jgi:hypothetical protein
MLALQIEILGDNPQQTPGSVGCSPVRSVAQFGQCPADVCQVLWQQLFLVLAAGSFMQRLLQPRWVWSQAQGAQCPQHIGEVLPTKATTTVLLHAWLACARDVQPHQHGGASKNCSHSSVMWQTPAWAIR